MKVRELIKALQEFHEDDVVVINDADTQWFLNIKYVSKYNDMVTISGGYIDIYKEIKEPKE